MKNVTFKVMIGRFRPLFLKLAGKSEFGKGVVGNCPDVNSFVMCYPENGVFWISQIYYN